MPGGLREVSFQMTHREREGREVGPWKIQPTMHLGAGPGGGSRWGWRGRPGAVGPSTHPASKLRGNVALRQVFSTSVGTKVAAKKW